MATRRSQVDVTVAPAAVTGAETQSYVDWGAVIAGAVLASAISLVLLAFGSGIGLSMASPFRGEGASKTTFGIALGLWVLWVIISSFMAGGYLAGRMRRRVGDATEHEVEVRDGAHGLIVWAVGVLIAAMLTAAGVSGVMRGGAEVARTVASAAAGDQGGTDPVSMTVDALFRATGETAGSAETENAKREVRRILAASAVRGDVSAEDKAYIVRLVAARTGVSPQDAERRINEVLGNARRAADDARKAGVLTAFLIAAALLAGGAAAWWGASTGGQHRDRHTDFSRYMRWR